MSIQQQTMKKAFLPALGKLPEIRKVEIPKIAVDEILVKMKVGSICNLTDVHTIEGIHPPHNLWAEGHFQNPPNAFPAPLGHEGAGEIVEMGKAIKGFNIGDRVQTWGESAAFAEYATTTSDHAVKIPDNLSYEEGCISQIIGEVNGIVEEAVYSGDVVAILGQGGTGIQATQLARLRGASKIYVSEPDEFKRKLALQLGADVAIDPSRENVVDRILELTEGKGVDTVIECVGIPETIKILTKLIKRLDHQRGSRGATIAQWGACREHVSFDFMELHWKGARIITAGSTHLDYSACTFERSMRMVSCGLIKIKPLITHRFQLDNIGKAFKMLMDREESAVKVIIEIS